VWHSEKCKGIGELAAQLGAPVFPSPIWLLNERRSGEKWTMEGVKMLNFYDVKNNPFNIFKIPSKSKMTA
jgi:hypothetical protein